MSRSIHFISKSKTRLTLFGVLVIALASAVGAIAYWTTVGTGSGQATVGTLNAPTNVQGTPSGATVAVSWTAPTGGTAPSVYYVTRNNGTTTSAACGSSAASPLPATPTSCNDLSVPSGVYTYTVVAVYHSWTAASAPSGSVTVVALDHFTVSAPASATAGSAFSVTVIANESGGATVGTYRGTIHFTRSDTQAGLPANYTFTSADNGSHTFTNAVTLKTVPSQTVAVNDTADSSKTGQATVTVNPATAATFTVSGYPSPTVAGIIHSFTVTAKDAFGNTATGYSGTVHFTATGDAAALLPADSTLTAGSGTFTATFKTVAGGTKTLTATDTVTSSITGSQSGITVTPAAASALSVAGYPSPTVAGVNHTFSVVAQDPFGNTATGYSGTVTFSNTNDAVAVLPANSTLTAGSGSFTATFKTVAGGTKTLTATDTLNGTVTGSQAGITVTPASAATLIVGGYPTSTVAGVSNSFTVTAKDAFGNTDTNYAGTVAFSNTNDAQAVLPGNSTLTAGTKTFSATFKTVAGGTKTLTATDTVTASITGSQTGITVTESATTKLVFITTAKTTAAGVSSSTITVERQDAFSNPTSGGAPLTINLSTSSGGGSFRDTSDVLLSPASLTIKGGNSDASFLYRDSVAGTPTITGANGSLISATQVETVTSAGASKLVFTTTPQTLTAGVTSGTITVQRQDQFSNPVTTGSTTVNLTTSSSGVFRDTADALNVTNVTISAGSSTGSFKYNDITVGTPTLTAAATGLTSTTQTETVSAANASKLVFTTAVQTLVVGQTSATITVQRQDVYGNPTTLPTGAISVALASSSTGGLFRNTADTATISSIQIPSGATSADFKYKDSLAGSPTITGSSSGLNDATQAETVNKASTTTSLSSSAPSTVFGQSVTFTATVAAVSPGSGTPTGTVTFKDGATTLCNTVALSGGAATCSTSSLAVGSHTTVTAVYSNDANFSASTSTNFTQTVNKAATTTSLASSLNPSVFGQSVTFTATVAAVSPGAGTPTGTVTFNDGAATICSTVALSSGQATCSTSSLAGGSHATVTAVYSSDASFSTSTSPNFTQTVNKADQTVSFTSAAPSGAKVAGPTYTPTATATSGLTVALTVDASSSSVCSISSGVVSFTAAGTCVLDANQAGNTNWNASPQVQQSFTVAKGDQTISFAALANKSFDQGPITVSATASSGLTVSFSSATPSVCTSGGTNGATITFVSLGTCTVAADQAGNANWNAAPHVQQSFTISKGTQTINFTSTAPAAAKVGGASYTPTATATSGLTVAFTIDATTSTVCSITAGAVTFQTVGTCKVDANQAGDTNWNAAAQAQQSFAVAKGDQAITFLTLPAKTFDQGPITVSATASSALAVTFTSATPSVCTVSGSTVNFVTVGTCTINANQAGDSNWNAAAQVQQSFTVSKGNQTITFTSTAPTTAKVGTTYAVTATGGPSGNSVTFTIDATTSTVCSIAGSTVTFTTLGTCKIDANQASSANYNAATQAQQSATVTQKGDQTITFTSTAPTAATVGGSTYTAAATGGPSGNAVTFTSATTSVCTSGGTNGATITFLAAGTCTVNADQAGNTNWNAATQVQQTFTVSTPLAPTALLIANGTGTAGKAEQNDVITVTWNQAIQLSSVCTSWTSSAQTVTGVTVTMNRGNGGSTNDLSFAGGTVGASSCGTLHIGTMTTTSSAYEGNNVTHSFTASTITWNSVTKQVVITLGTGTAAPNTVASSTYVFNPDPIIALAANPGVTATGTASTGAVKNF